MQQQVSPLSAPIYSREEALTVVSALEGALANMSALLSQETELTKAGKIRDAIDLQPEKARLTEHFIRTAERFRANSVYFKTEFPEIVTRIHSLHETFHAEIARNMTALATATALSESLISEIVETVQEHERPAGYTTGGTTSTNRNTVTPPLKLNLSL